MWATAKWRRTPAAPRRPSSRARASVARFSASSVGLGGEVLPLARFEELAAEAGIIRGRESWTRSLRVLRTGIVSQIESAEMDFDDEVRHRTEPDELRDLERLFRAIGQRLPAASRPGSGFAQEGIERDG